MVLCDNTNISQTTVEYPKKMDISINEAKKSVVQPQNIYRQIYTYFFSPWKRVIIDSKQTSENWKMVKTYIFINIISIVCLLISMFYILNLMFITIEYIIIYYTNYTNNNIVDNK